LFLDAGELREARVVGVHRRMNGVEREIKKPRFIFVTLDVVACFTAKSVGKIFLTGNRLSAAQHSVPTKITVRASEESKELVESSLLWMELRLIAEVPFPNQTRFVTN